MILTVNDLYMIIYMIANTWLLLFNLKQILKNRALYNKLEVALMTGLPTSVILLGVLYFTVL